MMNLLCRHYHNNTATADVTTTSNSTDVDSTDINNDDDGVSTLSDGDLAAAADHAISTVDIKRLGILAKYDLFRLGPSPKRVWICAVRSVIARLIPTLNSLIKGDIVDVCTVLSEAAMVEYLMQLPVQFAEAHRGGYGDVGVFTEQLLAMHLAAVMEGWILNDTKCIDGNNDSGALATVDRILRKEGPPCVAKSISLAQENKCCAWKENFIAEYYKLRELLRKVSSNRFRLLEDWRAIGRPKFALMLTNIVEPYMKLLEDAASVFDIKERASISDCFMKRMEEQASKIDRGTSPSIDSLSPVVQRSTHVSQEYEHIDDSTRRLDPDTFVSNKKKKRKSKNNEFLPRKRNLNDVTSHVRRKSAANTCTIMSMLLHLKPTRTRPCNSTIVETLESHRYSKSSKTS